MLSLVANQLYALGYKKLHATELKGRHVNALVQEWQRQGLTPGTIKNRMAVLRWWAEKVGRTWVLARDNAHYGISDRQYVTNISKARPLNPDALAKVRAPYVRMSLELQRVFGLWREEAIKFQPMYADRGDRVGLKASWTKGGKAREIPIRTAEQREVLNRTHQLAGRARSFLPIAPISSTSRSTSATRPTPGCTSYTVCGMSTRSSGIWNSLAGQRPLLAGLRAKRLPQSRKPMIVRPG